MLFKSDDKKQIIQHEENYKGNNKRPGPGKVNVFCIGIMICNEVPVLSVNPDACQKIAYKLDVRNAIHPKHKYEDKIL